MSFENINNKVKEEVKQTIESIKNMSNIPAPTSAAAPSGPYDRPPAPDPSEPSDDKEHLHEKRKNIDSHVHKKIIEVSDKFNNNLPILEMNIWSLLMIGKKNIRVKKEPIVVGVSATGGSFFLGK